MRTITWRADDDVVEALQRDALEAGSSANARLTHIVRSATDPQYVDDDAERLRARLRAAGLLAEPRPAGRRHAREDVDRARRAAGRAGPPASDLVVEGRG